MTKKHDIIWLDTADSTNNEAKRRLQDLDNLSVLSALEQTAGRGQRGNTWSAKPGENLTFSIIMKFGEDGFPEVRALDQFVISEIAALSIVDTLAEYGIIAKIKWPNDIYVGDSKICGILIENSLRDTALASSIIGIGLNVNQTVFNPSLPNPTSMSMLNPGQSFGLDRLLEDVMAVFGSYCTRYMNITGGYTRLRRLYLAQLWRIKEDSSFIDTLTGGTFRGRIKGISEIGHLLVEDIEKGELKEFAFKEIGYVI